MNSRLTNTSPTKTVPPNQKPYILVVQDINKGKARKHIIIKPRNDEEQTKNDAEINHPQLTYYENKESDESDTIWSHKRNAELDTQATEYFLQLRGEEKYKQLFADRKFGKNKLWSEIAKEMNDAGYYVGDGKEGTERCRQKFSNLEKSFLKYIRHIRSDTQNKREPPPFYEFMVNIVDPDDRLYKYEQNALLQGVNIDLLTSNSKDIHLPASSSKSNDSVEMNEIDFTDKQHNEIISLLKRQHSEIMSVQREFLDKIDKHLTVQNEQREKMLNYFINAMKDNSYECDMSKKRKLDSDSENI